MRRFAALLGLSCGLAACGSSSDGDEDEERDTLIQLSPSAFLGDVPCAEQAGALHVYVATLFDVGSTADGDEPPLTLPSSPPTSCRQSVVFGRATEAGAVPTIAGGVQQGRYYEALVEGYDRSDLQQLLAGDGRSSGIPVLIDPATAQPVAPRWTTRCGQRLPVRAEFQVTRSLYECGALEDAAETMPTQVEVRVDPALCSAEPPIERFVVRRDGETLGGGDCDQVFRFDAADGSGMTLELLAYRAGMDAPSLGGICSARPLRGATVAAQCDALVSDGSLELRLDELLEALGARCDVTLGELLVTLEGAAVEPLRFDAATCRGSARFGELPPGAYRATAMATRTEEGAEPLVAECAATVEPGLVARARCGAPVGG